MNATETLAVPYYNKGFTYNYASNLILPVFGIESGYICSEYSRAVVFSSSPVFRPHAGQETQSNKSRRYNLAQGFCFTLWIKLYRHKPRKVCYFCLLSPHQHHKDGSLALFPPTSLVVLTGAGEAAQTPNKKKCISLCLAVPKICTLAKHQIKQFFSLGNDRMKSIFDLWESYFILVELLQIGLKPFSLFNLVFMEGSKPLKF